MRRRGIVWVHWMWRRHRVWRRRRRIFATSSRCWRRWRRIHHGRRRRWRISSLRRSIILSLTLPFKACPRSTFGPLDSDRSTKKFLIMQVSNGISGIPFVLKFDKPITTYREDINTKMGCGRKGPLCKGNCAIKEKSQGKEGRGARNRKEGRIIQKCTNGLIAQRSHFDRHLELINLKGIN